jgi:8-oxo-dGTP diphosphatase
MCREVKSYDMKKLLLKIWRVLPFWLQEFAGWILRPRYQVAVGGLLLNEQGQLLLCEHTYRRKFPWGLPGGDLKVGEDPEVGIRREVYEETGLAIDSVRLILVENSKEIHHISLTYLCKGATGIFTPNDEVARIEYFDTDRLPGFFKEQGITIERALKILEIKGTSYELD